MTSSPITWSGKVPKHNIYTIQQFAGYLISNNFNRTPFPVLIINLYPLKAHEAH